MPYMFLCYSVISRGVSVKKEIAQYTLIDSSSIYIYTLSSVDTPKKKKVKLTLYQAVGTHRVVRRRGSHISSRPAVLKLCQTAAR
jgi:hypothetical protein